MRGTHHVLHFADENEVSEARSSHLECTASARGARLAVQASALRAQGPFLAIPPHRQGRRARDCSLKIREEAVLRALAM